MPYFINALIAITKLEKYDIVFTISQPPILRGVLGYIGKKLKKQVDLLHRRFQSRAGRSNQVLKIQFII